MNTNLSNIQSASSKNQSHFSLQLSSVSTEVAGMLVLMAENAICVSHDKPTCRTSQNQKGAQ